MFPPAQWRHCHIVVVVAIIIVGLPSIAPPQQQLTASPGFSAGSDKPSPLNQCIDWAANRADLRTRAAVATSWLPLAVAKVDTLCVGWFCCEAGRAGGQAEGEGSGQCVNAEFRVGRRLVCARSLNKAVLPRRRSPLPLVVVGRSLSFTFERAKVVADQ